MQTKSRIESRSSAWTRALPCGAALLGCLLYAGVLPAQQTPDASPPRQNRRTETTQHKGKVVGVTDQTLTMTIDGENRHTHRLSDNVRITIDGKRAKATDLKAGDMIEVTTPEDNPSVALAIAAHRNADQSGETARENDDRPRLFGRSDERQDRREERREDRRPRAMLGIALRNLFDGDGRLFDRDRLAPQNRENANQDEKADAENGVVVTGVMENGPADRANIRPGDRLIAINETVLRGVDQVMELIDRFQPDEKVTVLVQRDGKRYSTEATLAAGQDEFAGDDDLAADSPWLGILVATATADPDDNAQPNQPADDQQPEVPGVRIVRVFPTSPAARAGLHQNDHIAAVGGVKVTSAKEFVREIEKHQPGEQVELQVAHVHEPGSQATEQDFSTMTVKLGRRGDFLAASHQSDDQDALSQYDVPEHLMRLEHDTRMMQQHERMEGLLLDVLREVRDLRQQVETLKAKSGSGTSASTTPATNP